MHWSLLWTCLPDEALPLLIAAVGLAMVCGLLRGRAALALLALLLLAPVLGALVESLLAQFPPWVTWLVLAGVGLSLLKGLAALLLGPRAADTMMGSLAADLVRLAVRLALPLLLLPLVWWGVRWLTTGSI
jgi:hypothetical protein